MKRIKVSIIIPAYNSGKYIVRCVESAIKQTLREVEIIVVNDGSTDNTQDLIENLSLKDDRVIIINKRNGGLSSARNTGLDIAKGEYIQHLDGDDWIEPMACEETYQYASKNNIDIVVSDYYRDNDEGEVKYIRDLSSEKIIPSNEEYLRYFFQRKTIPAVWNKLIKREVYGDTRHPEGVFQGEDVAVMPRLILRSKKIEKLNKAFVHYIVNPNSITNFETTKKMYQLFEAYDEIEGFLRRVGKYEKFKDDLMLMRYINFIAFIRRKPFYHDNNYKKGLNYISSSLKRNNIFKSMYIMLKVMSYIMKYIAGRRI